MRLLVLLFLPFLFLYAKESDTCYSISLLSVKNNADNKLKLLTKYAHSNKCKILEIGSMLSVRCGCYDTVSQAKQKLELMQGKGEYKYAIVAPTYRYRFAKKSEQEIKLKQPKVLKKKKKEEKKPKHQITKKLIATKQYMPDESNLDVIQNSGNFEMQDETQTIDATLLGRYVSNENIYKHSPYFFALFESQYQTDTLLISAGLAFESRNKNEELLINNLELKEFGDNYTFKIGKMVQKVGVLDYFSFLDILNPSRAEFFYDTQLNIKKIPLWMSSIDYFINDELKLTAFIQPYDNKHASYSSVYVDYILNQFIPEYYKDVFKQEPLGSEVFYPVYTNSLVPYLTQDIQEKSAGSRIYLDKLSFGAIAEYSDETKKLGAVYFNKYSEIPLIRVDQNLLDAAIAYDNGENPSEELVNYLESGDYDPIKSVEDFRYQQFGLYGETTYKSFGLRAELAYRDKIPLFNNYSALASAGFAVDKLSDFVYNTIETQYFYLQRYHKNAYISMLRSRFKRTTFYIYSAYFENSFIASKMDTLEEYSIAPRYVISYKEFDLAFEGLVSKNNNKTNTFSLLLRGRF
jgi:hypothetical protein